MRASPLTESEDNSEGEGEDAPACAALARTGPIAARILTTDPCAHASPVTGTAMALGYSRRR